MESLPSRPIPLSRPTFGEEELEAVRTTLESGWVAGQGPHSLELESGFRTLTGRKHAIAVNNCTAGLHLAYEALGIGPGDEVIVADYSFPATAHAVLYVGAIPVFVDVLPDVGTLDPAAAKRAITPRTKAIVAVDTLGHPAEWTELQSLAAETGLILIEDAACSAGAMLNGAPAGSFGDAAVFSLHARKGITCGEGGVVVTDDDHVAEQVRLRTCFGMESALSRSTNDGLPIPVFSELGYNYKLSDILAAIACIQLSRLGEFREERARLAGRYRELLSSVAEITSPRERPGAVSAWQTFAITLAPTINRAALASRLREAGIGCNIGTYAMHLQPIYRSQAVCPVSKDLFDRHLALPMYVGLADADQDRVVETLKAELAQM